MVVFKYGVWEGWAFSTVFIINKKIIVPCICLVLFCCFTISYMWILTPLYFTRDWGQEEKGTTEDEMGRGHHWLDGCESEWTPGVGDGQGGLACCDSQGRKESDTTEWLNWTELNWYFTILRIGIILSLFYDGRNWGSETCSRWHARKALEQSWVSRVCSLSGCPVSTAHSLS